ncbi:MAG: hypothetical protein R3284_09600 [Rubricoccaceae bacterium]|nr:hypothetical protein [Rubricoccaceae bacterium]
MRSFLACIVLLSALVMASSQASAQNEYEIKASEWEGKTYVAHRDSVAGSDITAFYTQHLPAAYQTIVTSGLSPSGAPSGLYWGLDMETNIFNMAAAVPFSGDGSPNLQEGYEVIEVAAGPSLVVDYYGPYELLTEAHAAMGAHMEAEKLDPAYIVIEEYITDPTTEPDSSKWHTRIHYLFEE